MAAVLGVTLDGEEYLYHPAAHDPLADHGGLAAEFDLCIPDGPGGIWSRCRERSRKLESVAMIVTCKKHIPKIWIALSILPWAASTFKNNVMGTALIFSFKKFVDNPTGLTFILSLPWIIALLNAPICSFLSDRIWTRVGRRKPFVLTSLGGTIPCLLLMPGMPMPGMPSVARRWDARTDFADPAKPPVPLSALEELCQAVVLSPEFAVIE